MVSPEKARRAPGLVVPSKHLLKEYTLIILIFDISKSNRIDTMPPELRTIVFLDGIF
jgi:hypothetical protein